LNTVREQNNVRRELLVLNFKSIDDLPLLQVLFDDLIQIIIINIGVPRLFGVNHHHRTLLATVQTTGVIDAYLALATQAELFAALFYVIAGFLCAALITGLALATSQVGTEKHMVLVIGHTLSPLNGITHYISMTSPSVAAALKEADRCVKCGLCLPHCPTYQLSNNESESPRGRIALVDGLLRGRLKPDAALKAHIDSCLLCRKCETACPSKVDYHLVLDIAREQLGGNSRFAKQLAQPKRMRWLSRLGRWLPSIHPLLKLNKALPEGGDPPKPGVYSANRPSIGKVGLLTGCATSVYQGGTLRAAIKLLNAVGYVVVVKESAGCCGALAKHSGDHELAEQLINANEAAFKHVDSVISIATGCSSYLKEEANFEADDIIGFLANSETWSELSFKPLPMTVGLHRPCSQNNVLKEQKALDRLLASIPELSIVELNAKVNCCGAAGDYMLNHSDKAKTLRQPILDNANAQALDAVISSNVGCAMHIAEGLDNPAVPVIHPIILLAQQLEPH